MISLPDASFDAVISEIQESADVTITSGSTVSSNPALRFKEYTTSSAVTGAPLWNVTPSRNVNVQVIPSSEIATSLATAGTRFPSLSGFTKPSKRLKITSKVPAACALCGSRLSKSWVIPTMISPPATGLSVTVSPSVPSVFWPSEESSSLPQPPANTEIPRISNSANRIFPCFFIKAPFPCHARFR